MKIFPKLKKNYPKNTTSEGQVLDKIVVEWMSIDDGKLGKMQKTIVTHAQAVGILANANLDGHHFWSRFKMGIILC